METTGYAAAWTREENLEGLNVRIHDGVPLEELRARADRYRGSMFDVLYPMARPNPGDRVMEFGSGVGWIMESVLEGFPAIHLTGLDISENMITRARERFKDPRAEFALYDGFTFPFPDDYFQVLYSCAAVQHIEKHIAYLLFREMYRVLAPGGHAVIHLMSVHCMTWSVIPFDQECWNHVKNLPEHWHHYYAFDELKVLFSDLIGVDDFDVRHHPELGSFYVHFSKGTGRRFLRPDVPTLTYAHHFEVRPPRPSLWHRVRHRVATSPVGPALRPGYRALRDAVRRRRGSVSSD
ncbi:MAG: class I SAM-dependent methyltransferase [Candidatus Dormibacter sp.]